MCKQPRHHWHSMTNFGFHIQRYVCPLKWPIHPPHLSNICFLYSSVSNTWVSLARASTSIKVKYHSMSQTCTRYLLGVGINLPLTSYTTQILDITPYMFLTCQSESPWIILWALMLKNGFKVNSWVKELETNPALGLSILLERLCLQIRCKHSRANRQGSSPLRL